MRIDTKESNPAFVDLIRNPGQIIFLDANIFIPPDRSKFGREIKPFRFNDYQEIFLTPLLKEFPNLAVHETVYHEIVNNEVKSYVDAKVKDVPSGLEIHYDKSLNVEETALLQLFIEKLSIHSEYDPKADNAKDRGEIRSLSYMAVKNYLYFAANDALPIRLIKNAAELKTSLDDQGIIQPYELMYYFHRKGLYDSKRLRVLYKYIYYVTKRDKAENPDWGSFIDAMDGLYTAIFAES